MHRFHVNKDQLIFDALPLVEYATFMPVMKEANIHLFLQLEARIVPSSGSHTRG
jgi:hypothetical protein